MNKTMPQNHELSFGILSSGFESQRAWDDCIRHLELWDRERGGGGGGGVGIEDIVWDTMFWVPKWALCIYQILNIASSCGELHLVWILIVKSASLKHIVMTWYLTMPADYLLVINGWRTRACKSPNPPPLQKKRLHKSTPLGYTFCAGNDLRTHHDSTCYAPRNWGLTWNFI